jgi:hypothetical protein
MSSTSNNSGCLAAAIGTFSRLMLLFYLLARPAQFNAALGGFFLTCIGIVFLPFATLMYVLLWSPGVGLQGLDWLWVGLAAVLDILNIVGAGAANRDRIPAGYPGSTQARM